MQIGERLFTLRKASGETLQAVADAVGVSKVHIWELEKGRTRKPSFELVHNLARHFGLSVEEFMGLAEDPGAEVRQVTRIHRDLLELSERDRAIVEDTIKAMKARSQEPV